MLLTNFCALLLRCAIYGIYMDADLSMRTHMSSDPQPAALLFIVASRKEYLQRSVTQPVLQSALAVALVLSRPDYGSTVLPVCNNSWSTSSSQFRMQRHDWYLPPAVATTSAHCCTVSTGCRLLNV